MAKVKFGADQHDEAMRDNICGAFPQVDSTQVEAAVAAGIPWVVLIRLLWQMGPTLFQLINDLLEAAAKPGGLTLADVIVIASKYQGPVWQTILSILAALGLSLPTA